MRSAPAVVLAASLVLFLLALPSQPANAQEVTDPIQRGEMAWDDGRYADALRAFQEAYEATHNVALLLNVAAAQSQLEDWGGAVESYQTVLDAHDPALASDRRAIERALRDARRHVGTLSLSLTGFTDDCALLVDGNRRAVTGTGSLTLSFPLAIGAHHLVVHRGDADVATADVTIARGADASLALAVPVPIASAPIAEDHPDVHHLLDDAAPRRELYEEPWFWAVIGGSVVVVALAIGIGVGVGTASPSTYSGSFMPGQVTVP